MAIGIPILIQVNTNTGVASGSPYGSSTAAAPAGSLIVIGFDVSSNGSVSSLTDSAGNNYSFCARSAVTGFENEMWYCRNIVSLPLGGTWTATTSGPTYNITAAAYVTGANGGFDASASGGATSTTFTLTTGSLASSNEIAFGSKSGAISTWSEDPTWTTLSPSPTTTTPFSYKIVSTNSAVSWSPSWTPSAEYNGTVATFQASPVGWGFEALSLTQPRSRLGRVAATKVRCEFAIFAPTPAVLPPWAWIPEVGQPPHPHPERGNAAYGRNQFGTFQVGAPFGWEIQSVQPPAATLPISKRRAGTHLRSEFGVFTYIPPVVIPTPAWSWIPEIQQPPHPHPERGNAAYGRNQFGLFPRWTFTGWETQPVQPPHPRPERAGALMAGDTGIEAKFVFVPPAGLTVTWGWDVQPFQVRYSVRNRGAVRQRSGFGFSAPWRNAGWEIQPPQPPHLATERKFGALARGDEGIESAKPVPFQAFGWPIQMPQPPHPAIERREAAVARGDEGNQNPFTVWKNMGWEIQPPQPPHRASELKYAAVARGDDGIQGTKVVSFQFGWPIQLPQPPYRIASQHAAGWMTGDQGIEAPFVFVQAPLLFLRWYPDPWVPPHRRVESYAAIMRGDEGIEGIYVPTIPPPTPVPARQGTIIIPALLDYTVTTLSGTPAPVRGAHEETQCALNEAATLLLTVSSFPQGAVQLLFTRPDGSTFYVSNSPFLYSSAVFNRPYVIYTTAYGDLNQTGWWLVQIQGMFEPPGTLDYAFYVFLPNALS